MAIISIPSTIGGVTIPGTAASGPLGALFGSLFGLTNLQYPRDLGSFTKGHIVSISANEIEPIGYEESKEYKLPNTIEAGIKFFQSENTKLNLSLKSKKKKSVANISLYIPDTVNFQYTAGYGNVSLLSVAETVSKTAGALFSSKEHPVLTGIAKAPSAFLSAAQTNAAKLALSTQGLAINPQQQLLFDGIDFRSYQLAFTFTPYSREEAQTVKEIIKTFKKHAAPRIVTGGAGMFFIPPSTFNLKFLQNGIENTNINKVAESVITSIDVNYAPNGWAAHTDGAPVQTTLTINFKEIELIDRNKIDQKHGY